MKKVITSGMILSGLICLWVIFSIKNTGMSPEMKVTTFYFAGFLAITGILGGLLHQLLSRVD